MKRNVLTFQVTWTSGSHTRRTVAFLRPESAWEQFDRIITHDPELAPEPGTLPILTYCYV